MSRLSAEMLAFTSGLLTLGYLLAALFFLRFWRRSGDPLFTSFAGAFVLLAANQALPNRPTVIDPARQRNIQVMPMRRAGGMVARLSAAMKRASTCGCPQ